MEWLKPITEKLNANVFIFAMCLTMLLCWFHFGGYTFFVISISCAFYLIILFFYKCIQYCITKAIANKRAAEALNIMREEDELIRLCIEIWFKALPKLQIDRLLQLISWESPSNASNIKICTPDKEYISFNSREFTIERDVCEGPIPLVYQIKSNCKSSYPSYYIHPYLLELLVGYKADC